MGLHCNHLPCDLYVQTVHLTTQMGCNIAAGPLASNPPRDWRACCRHPLLLGDYLLQKDQQQAQQRSSSSRSNGARRSRRQFSNRKDDGDRAASDPDIDSEDESEARLGPPVSPQAWPDETMELPVPCGAERQDARTKLTVAVTPLPGGPRGIVRKCGQLSGMLCKVQGADGRWTSFTSSQAYRLQEAHAALS